MPTTRTLTLLLALGITSLQGQTTQSDADLDAEAVRAADLYTHSQPLAALPLYEELHAARPKNPFYTERLAMGYVTKSAATAVPEEQVAARNHARKLFLEAQAAGDSSDLLQIMLEKLGPAETVPVATPAPADDLATNPRAKGGAFAHAELLFSQGDLKGAVAEYTRSWQQFPTFYYAPLFAGDAEYKQEHLDEAGVWYARAIAIDPDIETAHRYWADALDHAGKTTEARKQYIEAFIADPYSKAPRLSLRSWADENRMRYIPPAITLPALPTIGKDGHINITMSPGKPNDPMNAIWLGYSMSSALWRGDKFKKTFPNEKTYRHSLAEEMDTLHTVLQTARELKIPESKWDPTLRSLMALEKDNMLECWILIDNPDNGTAQDYVAFRAQHHDLLRAYIEKYDLHPA